MKARNTRTNVLLLVLCAVVGLASTAVAQDKQQAAPGPVTQTKDFPTANSSTPYHPAPRDPFKKDVKPVKPAAPPKDVQVPPLARRKELYQKKKIVERSLTPLYQYIVGELDVLGVFKDQRGLGAFLRAKPTGTTFYARRGEKCFNGEVLRIENEDSGASVPRVLFREISQVEVNSKIVQQERTVAKTPGATK